jgi:cbb3-type cytochrome oxidase cytochrome c subunit
LGALARRLWRPAFQQMARAATQRHQHDTHEQQATMRMRFGVYYYAEPLQAAAGDAAAVASPLAQRKAAATKRSRTASPAAARKAAR